jgi:hypothetical protein
MFFGPALLVACNNDSPKISDGAQSIERVSKIVADLDRKPEVNFDFPIVISEYTRTDYAIRVITLSPGTSDSMRIVQPNRGTNYVIQRVRELR